MKKLILASFVLLVFALFSCSDKDTKILKDTEGNFYETEQTRRIGYYKNHYKLKKIDTTKFKVKGF